MLWKTSLLNIFMYWFCSLVLLFFNQFVFKTIKINCFRVNAIFLLLLKLKYLIFGSFVLLFTEEVLYSLIIKWQNREHLIPCEACKVACLFYVTLRVLGAKSHARDFLRSRLAKYFTCALAIENYGDTRDDISPTPFSDNSLSSSAERALSVCKRAS